MCGGATRRIKKPSLENSDEGTVHISSMNRTRSLLSRRQTPARRSVSRSHDSRDIGRVSMPNNEWSVWPPTITAAEPSKAVTATAS